MNICLGPDCGKPCKNKYCSKLCRNRVWKKSKTFLKKKCKGIVNGEVCKKPCRNKYCSRSCAASNKKEYKENCLTCGREFTYTNIYTKKRGGSKYCSWKCAASKYYFDENFFKRTTDVESTYEILGFVFGYGVIHDYERFEIVFNADKILLENFIATTKTSYPIKEIPIRGKSDKKYRLTIRSQITIDYLHSIGFTHNIALHDFPCILPEYKKYFIRGFLNSPNCCVYEKDDYNLVVVITKSYHVMRMIADFTGGEMLTKNLDYCCVFKDYDKFYYQSMLQNSMLTQTPHTP